VEIINRQGLCGPILANISIPSSINMAAFWILAASPGSAVRDSRDHTPERRFSMRKLLNSFACGVLLLSLLGSPAWADITEFDLPNPNSGPLAILVGPDGNLWFDETQDAPRIGRLNLAHNTITEFDLPNATSGSGFTLFGLTVGPDGNLWFAENNANRIGTMTLDGSITEFDLPTPDSRPYGITPGPDGNIWFTENLGNQIGRITPQGDIAEFPIPSAYSQPRMIIAGPDGNFWFSEYSGQKIGRITPDGQITEFALRPGSGPFTLTVGPDENIWFTAADGNWIGRMTLDGEVSQFPIPTPNSRPVSIALGPDGNFWFTENYGNRIGRITTDGVILAEFDCPTPNSLPAGITTGPEGNLWFAEHQGNKIGRLRAPANQFLLTAAPTVVSGTAFDITITALGPWSNIDTGYQGTVTFSTSDADSGVVLPADYTFTTGVGGDNGVHTFTGGVMLVTVGTQTLTATDTISGITSSVTITVEP
jgi:streptogramin lyase